MMALSFGFAGDFKASKDNFEKVKKVTSAPAVTMALQKFIHQIKKGEGLLDLSRAAYIEQVIKCI